RSPSISMTAIRLTLATGSGSHGESSPRVLSFGAMSKQVVEEAERELAKRDPVMRKLIRAAGPCTLGSRRMRDHFGELVRSIVFQQLAGKAAMAIHGRFVALFDG